MSSLTTFELWGALVPELKLECIQHLDFIDKIRLRATSTADRTIVDMEKLKLKEVSLSDINYGSIVEFQLENDEKYKIMSEDESITEGQVVPMFSYLLKNGIVSNLVLHERKNFTEESIAALNTEIPFKVTNVKILSLTTQALLVLKNLSPERLESVEIREIEDYALFDMVLSFESMKAVKQWKIGASSEMGIPLKLAQDWIRNDAAVGSKLNYTFTRRGTMQYGDNSNQDGRQRKIIHLVVAGRGRNMQTERITMYVIPSSIPPAGREFESFKHRYGIS
uniref:F-box domain-containing protein n=1 Tax=Caenorhabditis tropicalis TaxID=1561998 RepID=A0A1I7TLL7_9PELO